ncbi:Transposon Ty3-G Gag-Pol polyprotein [Camellia lanceoleosa]|uniref:Transposon Ty3-G Gag-Pol polyprotein n=1 Tax=Camellia lanceoleosa TaxID=1840588 RepID=A0ACC0GT70_9ERIC|nr:Transposon Ty3-G Gag-Pol polyprotein [Camellia lanceoleosa]
MITFMKSIHSQVRTQIEKSNAKYKVVGDVDRRRVVFEVGDLVWVVLSKKRYPHGAYTKLGHKKVGPCEVLRKINDNAYQVKLLPHLGISDAFNVQHLIPYFPDASSIDDTSTPCRIVP